MRTDLPTDVIGEIRCLSETPSQWLGVSSFQPGIASADTRQRRIGLVHLAVTFVRV